MTGPGIATVLVKEGRRKFPANFLLLDLIYLIEEPARKVATESKSH